MGCQSWPDEPEYLDCPVCDLETERYSNLRPLDPDEAQSLVNNIRFEEYYETYCEARGQSVSGPLDTVPDFDAELADLLS